MLVFCDLFIIIISTFEMSCWFLNRRSEQSEDIFYCKNNIMVPISIIFFIFGALAILGSTISFNKTVLEPIAEKHPLAMGEETLIDIRDGNIFGIYLNVGNFTVPIEDIPFKLYEIYPELVVLQNYLSFYYNETELEFGTEIRFESDNTTFAQVIGHYKNYYPITNKKSSRMHCGIYWIEYMGRCKDLYYENSRYRCMDELNRDLDQSMYSDSCFIIIY